MAYCGSPRFRVIEFDFCWISSTIIALQNYPLTKKNNNNLSRSERKQMKWLERPSPFHMFTNPCVINRFIFGQWVVIYYLHDSRAKKKKRSHCMFSRDEANLLIIMCRFVRCKTQVDFCQILQDGVQGILHL